MYIGIDLGGTNIALGLVDEKLDIVKKKKVAIIQGSSYEEILDVIAKECKEIREGIELAGIGIGIPGIVDSDSQKIIFCDNLGWKNVDIVGDLKKVLMEDIHIANDADCALYAEVLKGSAVGFKNVILFTLGTGVGSSVLLDGKIFLGGDKRGIELGHMTVEYEGESCSCGYKGCLESYASATALIRETKEPDAKTVFDQEDIKYKETIDRYYKYLAVGVRNGILAYRPDLVIIGGGISKQGDKLSVRLRDEVKKIEMYFGNETATIKIAALGNDAGIIGAAAMYRDNKKGL